MNSTVGIVLSAGKGTRVNSQPPKQYVKINNKMIVEYPISELEKSNIDHIYLVIDESHKNYIENLISKYNKIKKIIYGGVTKNDSIWKSIKDIDNNYNKIIFIPAVRPFVKYNVYDDYINLLDKYDAITYCNNILGYLYRDNRNILNRKHYKVIKSPTGYKMKIIKSLLDSTSRQDFINTESDIELTLKYLKNVNLFLYYSNEFNYKITYREDLKIAKKLLTD